MTQYVISSFLHISAHAVYASCISSGGLDNPCMRGSLSCLGMHQESIEASYKDTIDVMISALVRHSGAPVCCRPAVKIPCPSGRLHLWQLLPSLAPFLGFAWTAAALTGHTMRSCSTAPETLWLSLPCAPPGKANVSIMLLSIVPDIRAELESSTDSARKLVRPH